MSTITASGRRLTFPPPPPPGARLGREDDTVPRRAAPPTAALTHPLAQPRVAGAAFAPLPDARPSQPPPIPASVEDYIAEKRAEALSGQHAVAEHPGGLRIAGRPYVALECYLPGQGFSGWALCHDDPDAIRYFLKLFGPDQQAELAL